ncbi:MAG: hypothetical protein DMF63_07650 [Acidobacteria bacterium]|nr:MAG: hypothetical protein DMF63_07650 [Acidobacteriota bacterium]
MAPVVLFAVLLVAAQTLSAQNTTATDPKDEKKAASIATDSKEKKPAPAVNPLVPSKDGKTVAVTAEQVAESTIFIYGLGGGRATLNQIRKTTIERGKISVTSAEGRVDQASYSRWIQRAETLNKEKVRLDQEFPNARYSLVFNEEKIFGVVDDSIFTPREDASKAFENQIVHGLESLLRYKENESKIEYVSKEKVLGVEFHILDVIDKQSRKTRFYISAKTFRVMMLDYEQDGTKYRRKFYDYNYAQGTLVPYRSALFAGDKLVEETEVGTVSFGQKIDENMFRAG